MAGRELALCVVDGCHRSRRSLGAEWCETHYYRVRRTGSLEILPRPVPTGQCKLCGSASGASMYCSQRCSARASRGNSPFPACKVCGCKVSKGQKGRDPKTCGPACLAEWKRRLCRRHYHRSIKTEHGRNRIRSNEYKRKAMKRSLFVEDVDWTEVMVRDGWVCHICIGPISPDAVWPDPGFGTVDHVIPLSKGGPHSYANVKAAHLSCNCKKSNKLDPCHSDKTLREAGVKVATPCDVDGWPS